MQRSKSPSACQRRVEWHEAESEARRATQSDEDVHAAAAESMDRSDSKMNDARVRCMLEEVIDELASRRNGVRWERMRDGRGCDEDEMGEDGG